jgi:CHAD domain-containing protein
MDRAFYQDRERNRTMADAAKDRLHELVDALPESRVEAANRLLECLVSKECDPVMLAFLNAPEDDEPLTEEDLQAIEEAEEDIRQGRTRPLDEVMKAFGYES